MSSESDEAYESFVKRLPDSTHKPSDCPHENFGASVVVARLLDSGKFVADVRVVCVQCRGPFRFVGTPAGLAFDRPTVSIDGLELHAPIEPEGEKRLFSAASYQMLDMVAEERDAWEANAKRTGARAESAEAQLSAALQREQQIKALESRDLLDLVDLVERWKLPKALLEDRWVRLSELNTILSPPSREDKEPT